MSDCYILGVESSCDDTSAAVVKNGRQVLSNVINSQIPIHQKYGGVVPEIASRSHVEALLPVIDEAIKASGVAKKDLSAVAVTYGPGLVGSLLVGLSGAKSLAWSLDLPLVGVNHLEGHVYGNFLSHPDLEPPFLALVVSGGHTSLLAVSDYETFRTIGQTRDDAAGEAFDKVARVMGLPYPGGPEIDRLAKTGNPNLIAFPRALASAPYDFSFSGLKSAVINYLHHDRQTGHETSQVDVAASFQAAVVDVLVEKTIRAACDYNFQTIVIAGGVSANSALREALRKETERHGMRLAYPSPVFCTDNAAMIACRGYYLFQQGSVSDWRLNAVPGLTLGKVESEPVKNG